MLSNFFIIPVLREKVKVKFVPAIPTGAPTTLTEEIVQTLLVVPLRTTKILSMYSKSATYFISFYCMFSLINLG